MSLKDVLKDKLTEKELKNLKSSFSIVGDIAIIEIPKELEDKEEVIGASLMKLHKNVKTVLKKASKRKGKYRLRDYKVIAGEDTTKTTHKEFGCEFKVDLSTTYFSEREGKERERLAEKVQNGEEILMMFAGVGPDPIVIVKKNPEVEKIYAIEMNPNAFELMKENIRINKLSHKIVPVLGDVKEKIPELNKKFDRIVMPLPETAYKFLDLAFESSKENGVIHLYGIGEEETLFEDLKEKIEEIAEENNVEYEIINTQKVLPFGVRKYKIRIDIKVLGGGKNGLQKTTKGK